MSDDLQYSFRLYWMIFSAIPIHWWFIDVILDCHLVQNRSYGRVRCLISSTLNLMMWVPVSWVQVLWIYTCMQLACLVKAGGADVDVLMESTFPVRTFGLLYLLIWQLPIQYWGPSNSGFPWCLWRLIKGQTFLMGLEMVSIWARWNELLLVRVSLSIPKCIINGN